MHYAAYVVSGLVAFLHAWFLVMEMFLWTTPKVRRIFGTKKEDAEASKVLAANQGLYNGFLSAGLIYGIARGQPEFLLFFNVCVVVAGLYGAYSTGKPRILAVQSVPAAIAGGLTCAAFLMH